MLTVITSRRACGRPVAWCLCLSYRVVLHVVLVVVASHHVMLRVVLVVGAPTVRGETAGDAQDEELVGELPLADHVECVR
jgi:hypothetical protein